MPQALRRPHSSIPILKLTVVQHRSLSQKASRYHYKDTGNCHSPYRRVRDRLPLSYNELIVAFNLLFTSCIVTSAASKQDCTLFQQLPAALPARMTDTV